MEYVDRYMEQIESIIQGVEIPDQIYNDDITETKKTTSSLKNKYIFKDYYYQSSSTHDVGTPNKNGQQYLGKKVNE